MGRFSFSRITILVSAVLSFHAVANAQWTVFDPTNLAMAGKIWNEDISMTAKMVQEINLATQTYQNGVQIYQLGSQMSQAFSGGQKANWAMIGQGLANNYTRSTYGETINWPTMVNGTPQFAPSVWQTATVTLQNNPSWGSSIPGSSPILARLATIEAMDGAGIQCLQTTAAYRQTVNANNSHLQSLLASVVSAIPGFNSYAQQMNLANLTAAAAHQNQLAQGDIQACQAQEKAIELKQQRDREASALNFDTQVAQYQSRGSVGIGGTANSFASFRLP